MKFSTQLSSSGGIIFKKKDYALIEVFEFCSIGSQCPIFDKIGNARGYKTSKLGVLGEYHSWKRIQETG